MARLHEYQGKAILAANGFKIARGRAAATADDAVDTKGLEAVIKIQVWTTGRARLGGVMCLPKARTTFPATRRACRRWNCDSFP